MHEINADSNSPRLNRTILIVEDEPGFQKVLEQFLSQIGFEVIVEADVASALRHLVSIEKLDLIITDINLPGMDGYDLLESVRKDYPDLPVVFLSGLQLEDAVRKDSIQPDAILHKPISLAVLKKTIFSQLNIDDT